MRQRTYHNVIFVLISVLFTTPNLFALARVRVERMKE